MKVSERDAHVLQIMTKYCDELHETIQYFGDIRSEFMEDRMYQAASCMELCMIAEGIKLLSSNIMEKNTEVSWKRILEMGDFIGGQFYNADFPKVWDMIHDDIPPLRTYCADLLKENNCEIIRIKPIPKK